MPAIPEHALYIACPLAKQRLADLHQAAASLEPSAARLLGVDFFYRADTDVLLLLLRLDARGASHTAIARLKQAAEAAELAVLEPARLEEGDRRAFLDDYLPRYPLHLTGFPTVTDALRALSRDLGARLDAPDPAAPPLAIRFRRGSEWQAGRLKSLGREGLHVVTGAPPRVGDVIDISIGRGTEVLELRGEVVYVARDQAGADVGGAGFNARFLLRTNDERHKLEGMLRAEGVGAVRAAPSRREARYPVHWPVIVRSGDQAVQTAALDVSASGMFVGGETVPAGRSFQVQFEIDDATGPVHATATVCRRISPDTARARGIPAGVGVEITASAADADRFRGFVERVGRRAHRAVVVATDAARAKALASHLGAAGYIAYGVEDEAELLRLTAESPPDLVVCSSKLRTSRAVQSALAARRVVSCSLEHDATPASVRGLVDLVLLG
jgi:hypothetical protein